MDFTQAEQQRQQLSGQLARGQITPEAYAAAVNTIRVTDSSARWWQPDPAGSGWLVWNGSAWIPATPPSSASGLQPGTAKDLTEFKSQLMTVDDFRKMSREVPLAKRPQKWWDLLSILGGIASAVLWLLYSGIREGFDFLTPVLMVGIPVILLWFRADIDVILHPVQPYRQNVNKLLLVGIGMAFPFLTSFILFTLGIRNYPLIQWNMIIGTLGAYAITRNPASGMPGNAAQPGAGKPPVPVPHGILVVLLAALGSFLVLPVRADDCARDLLNAQDCLRTEGYAEGISGAFSTLLSTSVNGPTVVQTLSSGGTGPQPPAAPPAQPSSPAQPPQQTGQPVPPAKPDGPDSLPINPDDVQNIDEAIRDQPPAEPPVTPPTTPPAEPPVTPPTTPPAEPPVTPPATPPAEPPVTPPTTPPAEPPVTPPATPPAEPPVTPPATPPTEPAVTPPATPATSGGAAQDLAAAAAVPAATAPAAAVPPGIDPHTGRRILTPEQQARRDFLIGEMERTSREAAEWSNYADNLGMVADGLEVVEKTADIAIDVGSVLSPGAGSRIKNIYGATKTILKGASESYAAGDGITSGLIKGGAEAAVDKALDALGGKIADRFNGKVPGFGKYEAPDGLDMGDLSLGQIRDRLRGAAVPDTGDAIQNIRAIATQRLETSEALGNAAKNAVQGQVQSWALWDRIKQAVGVTKPD